MKVLFVIPKNMTSGGAAQVARNVVGQLRMKGHEVLILHPGNSVKLVRTGERWDAPAFEIRLQMPFGDRNFIISLLLFLVFFPIALAQLVFFLRREKTQVINVHYPSESCFYFAVCRRILPVSLVTSPQGADVFPDGIVSVRPRRALRSLLRASDLVVAPSERFRDYLVRALPEIQAKAIFIHPGTDVDALGSPSVGNSADGLPPRYMLSVSAFKKQKAIDVLIRAWHLVESSAPDVALVVVGGGHLRAALEDLARSLGIWDRIRFLGPLDWPEVVCLLQRCEIFVLPSRFETFGIAILEAMACRKPVIASTAGGIPEIITHGKDGILVEADDAAALAHAMSTLLGDRLLQRKLADNGYRTVSGRFRSEMTGGRYESAFSGLLGPKAV